MGYSLLCYSLFTFISYFAPNVETIIALRFLACLGIGGVWPSAVALAPSTTNTVENPSTKQRLRPIAGRRSAIAPAEGPSAAVRPAT